MISRTLGQTHSQPAAEIADPRWRGIFLAGGLAAFSMLVLMIVQIFVYVIWPPPATAGGFFSLFQDSWLLGLLSLDLLYIVDSVLLILIYLAVYFVLRRAAQSAMLIALVFGLTGIAAYFASNTAFDIYYLLNTIVLFIFSSVMLRSRLFSNATAYLGFLAGLLMVVPSSAGTLGLYFSLASLLPWAIWLVLVGQRLLHFGWQVDE